MKKKKDFVFTKNSLPEEPYQLYLSKISNSSCILLIQIIEQWKIHI